MNNFKRFITVCAFAGLLSSSTNVKAAQASFHTAQPSEQSKAVLNSIKTMVSALSIDEAKAIYMENLEQVTQKMNSIIEAIDWTGFIKATKNHDNSLAGQELTKITQKIFAPLSANCEVTLVQAVCLSVVEKQDSEILLKIITAISQCAGQSFAKLANQQPAQAEDCEIQFITNVINPAMKELLDSLLASTRSILYPVK